MTLSPVVSSTAGALFQDATECSYCYAVSMPAVLSRWAGCLGVLNNSAFQGYIAIWDAVVIGFGVSS